jgi:hypothetical protein
VRVVRLLAVAAIAVAAFAQPAAAKQLRPAAYACWQLGQWRGTVAAGITDVRLVGQQEAGVWRGFEPIRQALPHDAWRAFDQNLSADGLVRYCQRQYRASYARGKTSGASIQSGFVRDGPCNIFRSDDGILFIHQRAHVDTPQEHALVDAERQNCANARHRPTRAPTTSATQ